MAKLVQRMHNRKVNDHNDRGLIWLQKPYRTWLKGDCVEIWKAQERKQLTFWECNKSYCQIIDAFWEGKSQQLGSYMEGVEGKWRAMYDAAKVDGRYQKPYRQKNTRHESRNGRND